MSRRCRKNENRHHIIYPHREWGEVQLQEGKVRRVGRVLRGQKPLIITMDRGEHRKLHELANPMPPLGPRAVRAVLTEYNRLIEDPRASPRKSIETLQSSIERIPPSVLRAEDHELAELCLRSLDIQKPIIVEAVSNGQALYEEFLKKSKSKEIPLSDVTIRAESEYYDSLRVAS